MACNIHSIFHIFADLDSKNIHDASLTSAEIDSINDPKLKSKVIGEKQKVSDMKAELYTTMSKSVGTGES